MKKQNGEQHHAARDAETTTGEGLQEANFTDKSVTEVFTADLGDGSQDEKRFTGMNVSDWLFLEFFAGTARLSKVARDVGVQILPVDKTNARASQVFIAQYDLADPNDVEAIVELVRTERHRNLAIHLAPACGTEAANLVYSATAVIVKLCLELHILRSVENPPNSLFWFFPEIEELLDKGYRVDFHHCMHGGTRNKLTTLWATQKVFGELSTLCDGRHEHAKWNPKPVGQHLTFPTAEEAAYPMLLCKRLVAILLSYAKHMGAEQPHTLQEQLSASNITSHRWILNMLPKGKRMKPLVSEVQTYKMFAIDSVSDPEKTGIFDNLPKGARVVQRRLQWGKIRVDEHECRWLSGDKSLGFFF